jgi:hypothetical protein
MLMSCRAVCAHMMLAFRRAAVCLAAAANSACGVPEVCLACELRR